MSTRTDDKSTPSLLGHSGERSEQAQLVSFAIIIGIFVAAVVIAFRHLIMFIRETAFFHHDTSLTALTSMPWWTRLMIPAVGGYIVGLTAKHLSKDVSGSGIPLVMNAVWNKGGVIPARIIPLKAFAAAVTIGTGGSAGRQGPVVHIGSAIGSTMSRLFHLSARHTRTLVACGAASAIAATFNAPIGGVLFAIEVILGEMRIIGMTAIVIASVVATVFSRYFMGDMPAFSVPSFAMKSPWELLSYGLMGITIALIAVLFMHLFSLTNHWNNRLSLPEELKPALGGLFVGLIALFVPHIIMVGADSVNDIIWGRLPLSMLLLILIAKIVATPLTISSGGSGGIFFPSLIIGATIGAVWSRLTKDITPFATGDSGAYALVGMGALFAAVTHAPITAVLLVFEMTDNYRIIPALMLTSVLAYLLSSWLHPSSLYHDQMSHRGIKIKSKKSANILKGLQVKDVDFSTESTVRLGDTFFTIIATLFAERNSFLIVMDNHGRYEGTIEFEDVKELIPVQNDIGTIVCAADMMNSEVPFVVPTDTLDVVMHLFGRINRSVLAVVNNPKDRKVIGAITTTTIIETYNKELFSTELSDGFGSIMSAVSGNRMVELLGDIYIGEIPVHFDWTGKTVQEIDLRKRYGLSVLLIHRPTEETLLEGRGALFPSPDTALHPGDRLLVMGNKKKLSKFTGGSTERSY